jgi:hypothetical protein
VDETQYVGEGEHSKREEVGRAARKKVRKKKKQGPLDSTKHIIIR